MRIFHLVAPAAWALAVASGEYRPASIEAEGFVHFSFADQVAETANLLYRDEPELITVEVDSDRLDAQLRIEDSYGSGSGYPHVYGPVPTGAAVASHPLRRDAQGDWTFTAGDVTAGGAAAAASRDR